MSYVVFYINPVQQKIYRRWVDNVEVIAKKLDIKDEDLLLMIPELYTSVASCFVITMITKNMAFFWFCIYFLKLVLLIVIVDTAKFSRTGYIYKQKKRNTCTGKLQEIHS